MEQTKQNGALTFTDILRMFRGKVILVICITLAFAILCGGFVAVDSLLNVNYGTEIKFHLSHADSSHEILTLLDSEAFAEKLLLDENGLPPKSECDAEDYEAALAAIKAYNNAREAKYEASKVRDLMPLTLAVAEGIYGNLQKNYEEIYNILTVYKLVQSDQIANMEEHKAKILEYEEKLAEISAEKADYEKNHYLPALREKLEADEAYEKSAALVNETRKTANELTEKVVGPWRKASGAVNDIKGLISSLEFRFESASNSTKENESTLFLIVSVSGLSDKDTADKLINSLKARTPEFVEENFERITGDVDVNCSLISTTSEAHEIGRASIIKNAAISAAVGAIAGFVVICAIIICKELFAPIFAKTEKQKNDKE